MTTLWRWMGLLYFLGKMVCLSAEKPYESIAYESH
jgi:hypothetical protein